MSSAQLFYTPQEVAEMFRMSPAALNSQRKRGTEPGSLAVKVGGRHLYPTALIDHYLERLTQQAQGSLDLADSLATELFRMPSTNRRILTLAEASQRLGLSAEELEEQWEADTYPGALGFRVGSDTEIQFTPRDLDIWIQANANQSSKDSSPAQSD